MPTPTSRPEPEALQPLITQSDLCQALLASEEFQEFWKGLLQQAEANCVRVCKNRASHYEKAEASGIINFLERAQAEMVRVASKEYRERLKRSLEEVSNVKEGRRPRRGRNRLRGIREALGQF